MAKETKLLTKKILAIGESRKHFKNLLVGLREKFKPEGFYENLLVYKLAVDLGVTPQMVKAALKM